VGADGRFARALFACNGEAFATAILDSAPSRVSTCLRGDLLIDLFLTALNLSANGWNDLDGDGRGAVIRWLKKTLTEGGRELRERKRLTKEERQREFLALVEGVVSDFTPHSSSVPPPIRCSCATVTTCFTKGSLTSISSRAPD
jgi:hypothetical protein